MDVAGEGGAGPITAAFDDLGEVTQSVRAYSGLSGQTLTYAFYPDGSRSAMTTPGGNFSYDYDADGRYTSMGSPVGTAYASYLDNGWQQSRTLPNGILSTYSLNAVGALTGLPSTLSSNPVSSFSSFSYDGVFNLTGFSANYGTGGTLPNGSRSFGYDTKDRLTSSSIPTSGTTTVSSTFGFDSAGNRNNVNGASVPFNSDNQLSAPGNWFDGAGNPGSYGGNYFTSDPESRITAVGSANTETYRADGLRASKTVGSATTYYLYDGGEPIVELNSAGAVTALNVFAPDGLVARTAGSATTEYVFDQQGNVADRTDTTGAVQSITQYDAWGNEQAISGTPSDPFGYNAQSGYYLDRETGLYLCQHRFYDPVGGIWLNRDPIGYGGGTNLYGYCSGRPIGWADGSGHQAEEDDYDDSEQADAERISEAIGRIEPAPTPAADPAGACAQADADTLQRGGDPLDPPDLAGLIGPGSDPFPGIYKLPENPESRPYVGQSGDLRARLTYWGRTGMIYGPDDPSVEIVPVYGGKTQREIAEQQLINSLGGIENLSNKRNPIGPQRAHLMPQDPFEP
ncbi:MAG: RHS repeat-associated core domain-containing protein [Fimbriimonadaceae bacterium]